MDVLIMITDLDGNLTDSLDLDFWKPGTDTKVSESSTPSIGIDTPGAIKYNDENNTLLYVGTSSRLDNQNLSYSVIVWSVIDPGAMSIDQIGHIDNFIISGDDTTYYSVTGEDVIIATEPNHIYITGSTTLDDSSPIGGTAEDKQFLIAKVDTKEDSVIWQSTRGFAGEDQAIYIDEFDDNNLVVIGHTNRNVSSEGTNLIFMSFNSIGTPKEGMEVPIGIGGSNSSTDIPTDVYRRGDSYVVTGYSITQNGNNRYPFFSNALCQASGAFNLTKADTVSVDIGSEASQGSGQAIALTNSGEYVLVGYYDIHESKNSEAMVSILDPDGDSKGINKHYGLSLGDDAADDVAVLSDGSILVLGTFDFGGGNKQLGLMKLNGNGDLAQ